MLFSFAAAGSLVTTTIVFSGAASEKAKTLQD